MLLLLLLRLFLSCVYDSRKLKRWLLNSLRVAHQIEASSICWYIDHFHSWKEANMEKQEDGIHLWIYHLISSIETLVVGKTSLLSLIFQHFKCLDHLLAELIWTSCSLLFLWPKYFQVMQSQRVKECSTGNQLFGLFKYQWSTLTLLLSQYQGLSLKISRGVVNNSPKSFKGSRRRAQKNSSQ